MDRRTDFVSDADALVELRERLGLHEQVPQITQAHLLYLQVGAEQGDDALVTMCCHDDANERAHHITAPYTALPPDYGQFVLRANRMLSAAWN